MYVRCLLLVILGALAVVGSSNPCWAGAKERTQALKLVKEGAGHQKAESWEEARDAFAAAVRLRDTPRARLGLANALYNLGQLIEAREHAQNVADNKRATWWDRKHARDRLGKIEKDLPHLTVGVPVDFTGAVRVDDKEWLLLDTRAEINPGTVTITASAKGFVPFERIVVLDRRADVTVSIELDPESKGGPKAEPKPNPKKAKPGEASADDGSTSHTLGYVSLAVGGAGLLAGTAFGVLAGNTRVELRSNCKDDICSEKERDTYDRGVRQANYSTIGFVIGGAGVGLGTILLMMGPNSRENEASTAKVRPYVSPTGAGVLGRF